MEPNKKDDLFSINLGEELIEIPDKSSEEENAQKSKSEKSKTVETDEGVTIHDDGSFDINDFLNENKEDDLENNVNTEKKKDEKSPSKTSLSDSSPSSSPYLAFAKDRAEEGVFLDFTEDEWKELVEKNEGDEAQALKELHVLSMSEIIKSEVEKYKESLTPEERALYEAKEKGVPVDEYALAKKNYNKYSKIVAKDLENNIALQEDVMTKLLEYRGYTSEEIKEEIDGYKALDNLEIKAKKALEVVPKIFEKKVNDIEANAAAEEQSKKDSIRQRVAKMKSLIDNIPEIIPGIKLNKQTREKIMDSMTVPVAKDKEGRPLNPVMLTRSKNPEGFELLVHYYHQLGLFNIDNNGNIAPDFSKISKIESKKAVDSLRSAFESRDYVSTGKAPKFGNSDDGEEEFTKAFRRL